MSQKYFYIVIFILLLTSCGSSKSTRSTSVIGKSTIKERGAVLATRNTTLNGNQAGKAPSMSSSEFATRASKIITLALSYEGTRYKYGGMDKSGMDCSGLVYTCYKNEDIELPRISRDMATQGVRIKLEEIAEGDLVFFKIGGRQKAINHVGLVVETDHGDIKFIHSTTKLGVIVSSLEESYWKNAFIEVRRII